MVEHKKINFEDFLKIYPPLTEKVDPSNYKTYNNYFKKREKKEEKKEEEKEGEEKNEDEKNIKNKNKNNSIEEKEKEEGLPIIEEERMKEEPKEEEWYLVNKGIDLQNKKRKRTNDIRQALEAFFNQSDLISKLAKYFYEFQSELMTPTEPIKHNKNVSSRKSDYDASAIVLPTLPSFIKDKVIENKILLKIKGITNKLTDSVKILKCPENYYIIRMFEIGEQCYFLLSGRLSVLKPVEYKNVKITYEEYFIYLMTLYHNNEINLIEQLIEINRKYINLHYLDNLLLIVKAYFIVKINKDINDNYEEMDIKTIDKKLKDFYLTYEDYNLKRAEIVYQIAQIKYNSNPEQGKTSGLIKNYLLSVFKPSLDDYFIMDKYKFLFEDKHEKGCSLFKYEVFICLFPGAFFGETALENSNKRRNASIRTEEDCIILSLNNDTYSNLLSDGSKKIKAIDIAFICSSFFFGNISPILFDKYYFPFFKSLNKKKDDIIFHQNEEVSSVFFLKEGELKFEISCSVLDLYNMIKSFIYAIEKNNHIFKLNEKIIKNLKSTYLNDTFYFNLKNRNDAFNEQLKNKKTIFVYRCNTSECIGLIEYFLGSSYNMLCYVSSINAKLFEISKYNLEKIINGEKLITNSYYTSVLNKLLSKIKRFNNIKEDYMKQIEFKIKEKIYDDSKKMNYYIRGQVGSSKPYIKEKIKIRPNLYDDNNSISKSNSNNNHFNTTIESNIMPSITTRSNNKQKRNSIIIKRNVDDNNNIEKYKKINNYSNIHNNKKNISNISLFKKEEEKKTPNILAKTSLNNIKLKLNNIKKNTISNTIVNCGRKFLSLRQIKNKIKTIELDTYEYNHLKGDENSQKIEKIQNFNKNEFGLSQSNFRYDLLNSGGKLKFHNSNRPFILFSTYKKNEMKSSPITNRTEFWKNKQIQNFDKKLDSKKLMNTMFIHPIKMKKRGNSTGIEIEENKFLLSQYRNIKDF
jgi:CRP-like cAMP-binding protein